MLGIRKNINLIESYQITEIKLVHYNQVKKNHVSNAHQ